MLSEQTDFNATTLFYELTNYFANQEISGSNVIGFRGLDAITLNYFFFK